MGVSHRPEPGSMQEGGFSEFFGGVRRGVEKIEEEQLSSAAKPETRIPKPADAEIKERAAEITLEYDKYTEPFEKDQDVLFADPNKGAYAIFDARGPTAKGREYAGSLKGISEELIKSFEFEITEKPLNPTAYRKLWKEESGKVLNNFEAAAKAKLLKLKDNILARSVRRVLKEDAVDSAAAFVLINKFGDGCLADAGDCGVFILRHGSKVIEQLSDPTFIPSRRTQRNHPGGFGPRSQKMFRRNFNLQAGDVLIICSDGLIRSEDNQYGLIFPKNAKIAGCLESPAGVAAKAIAELARDKRGRQYDDQTIMVLKAT